MKALQFNDYGDTSVLHWTPLPMVNPGPDQVLILVKAASINPTDCKIRSGVIRFPGSDHFPKSMGMDFAGIVAKKGENVTHLKDGDKVMGYMGTNGGSFADCMIAPSENTFLIPGKLTYEQATTLPMNAGTAIKVVNDYLKPSAGKTIFINGATGGIGLFAVQLCKLAGAIVTATAGNTEGSQILHDLGTDQVIDYHVVDILKTGGKWDAILDASGNMDFEQGKEILTEYGEFSTMVPKGDPSLPGRTFGTKKERLVFAQPGPTEFLELQDLVYKGKIRTFISQIFSMSDAIDTLQQFELGTLRGIGKVVLINDGKNLDCG